MDVFTDLKKCSAWSFTWRTLICQSPINTTLFSWLVSCNSWFATRASMLITWSTWHSRESPSLPPWILQQPSAVTRSQLVSQPTSGFATWTTLTRRNCYQSMLNSWRLFSPTPDSVMDRWRPVPRDFRLSWSTCTLKSSRDSPLMSTDITFSLRETSPLWFSRCWGTRFQRHLHLSKFSSTRVSVYSETDSSTRMQRRNSITFSLLVLKLIWSSQTSPPILSSSLWSWKALRVLSQVCQVLAESARVISSRWSKVLCEHMNVNSRSSISTLLMKLLTWSHTSSVFWVCLVAAFSSLVDQASVERLPLSSSLSF